MPESPASEEAAVTGQCISLTLSRRHVHHLQGVDVIPHTRCPTVMPLGYDSWVGEQGLRLSGGERQRVAIARALLRDAPLLILDEPSANLDSLTETKIMATFWGLAERRTVLLITHRLAGLDAVDEIIVMSRGRVVERGNHCDLMRTGGLYRHMWGLRSQTLVVG
jgi:ABC-type multidrug transport system fused ATPase/permease subunit